MSKSTFNTVVFSRKNTYNNPDEGSSLASVIHRADRNGKQATALSKPGATNSAQAKGLSKLFNNLCNCLGLAEQHKAQQQQHMPPASPQPIQPHVLRPLVPPSSQADVARMEERTDGHLGPIHVNDYGKKCLVLDLDETLVHSSFRPTSQADYIIPVEIEGTIHNVYVAKRPGVDEFLRVLAEHYEIVVYTASLSKYADPLLDQLDVHRVIRHRLFREHCVRHEGSYVKDLSTLNRDLSQTIIIDNSAMSYIFHPQNAIGCTSFIDDMSDRELVSIQKFLLSIMKEPDVRDHLYRWSPDSAHLVG